MNIRAFAIAAVASLVAVAFGQGPSSSAEEMVAKIEAIKPPAYDQSKKDDKAYVDKYMADYRAAMKQRSDLILEFYKQYPTHEKAPTFAAQRWGGLIQAYPPPKDQLASAIAEVEAVMRENASEKLVEAATLYRAQFGLMEAGNDSEKAIQAAEIFVKRYPSNPRGASLLASAAETLKDKAARKPIYERILRDYKDTPASKYIPGKIRQIDGTGKPFELAFTDAINGKKVDMKDLRGKVVVIDFWATWCGPCIAELPKMKELYAKYKDQGVEFIGVSLDQPEEKGGLKALREFVPKNDMPWPQYYQGNFWDSEFSKSWGINAIPCLFLIDKNGNLVDVEARQDLENKIKKLLGS